MRKGFALPVILVIVVVEVAASIVYFLFRHKPTSPPQPSVSQALFTQADETADWKTYQSDKFSYKIRIPSEFTIIDRRSKDTNTDLFENLGLLEWIEIFSGYTTQFQIDVAIYNLKGLSLQEWISSQKFATQAKVPEIPNAQVAGLQAYRTQQQGTKDSLARISYYIPKSDRLYVLLFEYEDGTVYKNFEKFTKFELIDQILSTFQFID